MRDLKTCARDWWTDVPARSIIASSIVALVAVSTAFAAHATAFSGSEPTPRSRASMTVLPSTTGDSQTALVEQIHLSDAQRSAINDLNAAYQQKFSDLIARVSDSVRRPLHAHSGVVNGTLSSGPLSSQAAVDSGILTAVNALQAEYNGKYRVLLTSDQRGVLDRAAAYAAAHAASMIPPRAPGGVP